MRVALVTDALATPTRGNFTTVQRWLTHVRGVEVETVPADPDRILRPVPDLVHGYHARHGGLAALALARRYGCPLVVSLGGTDLYELVTRAPGSEQLRAVLRGARCVTGAFPSFRDVLWAELGCQVPYAVIPRGTPVSGVPTPRRPDGTLRILLPSGLRPVKDPLLAIDLARALVRRGLPLSLRILGSVLDEGYAARVAARAAETGFVEVGQVPPERMAEAYRETDVVWNTSVHEGGANALLEAVAHGCAVFARDVPGNRELFRDGGPPGALFDPQDLDGAVAFHLRLLGESAAGRRARAQRGVAWLRAHHDPAEEARTLLAVWRRELG
ncbi:MAG: GPMC system family 4 glycosyltransferase [Deferrisomatales bacterium]